MERRMCELYGCGIGKLRASDSLTQFASLYNVIIMRYVGLLKNL